MHGDTGSFRGIGRAVVSLLVSVTLGACGNAKATAAMLNGAGTGQHPGPRIPSPFNWPQSPDRAGSPPTSRRIR